MTLAELLRAGSAALTAAGVASPQVDAELLLAALVGVERASLPLLSGDQVTHESAAAYRAVVARRAAREPLQHIVGEAPFRHLMLAVGPGVFVPRPETELLVDAVLPTLRTAEAPVAVDLCAGAGAMALAIAGEVPAARVYAVEQAPEALVWLRRNAAGSSVEVVAANITDPALLDQLRGSVHAVVSNPPYVPEGTSVSPEVRADPPQAVFAGADGLALIPDVIARAADLLRPGGVLAIEHDDSQGESVPALLTGDERWRDVADHLDLSGRPRYVVAFRR